MMFLVFFFLFSCLLTLQDAVFYFQPKIRCLFSTFFFFRRVNQVYSMQEGTTYNVYYGGTFFFTFKLQDDNQAA